MKQIFSLTKENIERSRVKLLEERPKLAKKPKPKKITGNKRDAGFREMLIPHFGTKVIITCALSRSKALHHRQRTETRKPRRCSTTVALLR